MNTLYSSGGKFHEVYEGPCPKCKQEIKIFTTKKGDKLCCECADFSIRGIKIHTKPMIVERGRFN